MMYLQLIAFIVLALVILSGLHYFLYFSLIHFFSITDITRKNILLALIVSLTISFILSSLLTHWKENLFLRDFYFFSGLWLGFFANFLLAAAIVWLIIGLAKLAGINTNTEILGIIFLTAAFAYSIYGIRAATHPKIKNILVTIPNLPESWKNKKIVQLSDMHLGLIYGKNFMQMVAKKINSEHPEMVLLTGDFFDGMDGIDLNDIAKPLNDIEAPKGIYFVTGNHETYLGLDRAFSALVATKAIILNDQVVDIDGLKLIGINYPARNEKKDVPAVLQSMEKDFSGKPNILLYHAPTEIVEAQKSGVNLQLSGHTHHGQIFPLCFITNWIFKGYDYGLHKIGNFSIYTSSGVGTWGPTMRTGTNSEIVIITLN